MDLFKDLGFAAAAPPPAPTRTPLKVLNGPPPPQPQPQAGKPCGPQLKEPRTGYRVPHHHPGLELCLGNSTVTEKRLVPGNFPSKIHIGSVGSCLDAQAGQVQLPYGELVPQQRRVRRAKQPTVILKLSEEGKPVQEILPCGVLGELNPGIIGRVRDSKQVQSIIGAVLSNRKRNREFKPGVACKKPYVPSVKEAVKEPVKKVKVEEEQPQVSESLSLEGMMFFKDKRELEMGLSDPEMDEVADTVCSEDAKENVPPKMAYSNSRAGKFDPAGVWYKLLTQDIKGRISALKRSRRRVRTAIVAKDENIFAPPNDPRVQENFKHHEDPARLTRLYERHVDKWKALFVNMDNCLGLEAANLVRKHKLVPETKLNSGFSFSQERQWEKLQKIEASTRAGCTCSNFA